MRLRDSCALAEGHHPMIEAWSRHRLACLRIEEHALAGFRLSAVPFRFERKHGYRLAGHDLLCHFGKQMIDAAEIMQDDLMSAFGKHPAIDGANDPGTDYKHAHREPLLGIVFSEEILFQTRKRLRTHSPPACIIIGSSSLPSCDCVPP